MNRAPFAFLFAPVLALTLVSCSGEKAESPRPTTLEDWHTWQNKAASFGPVVGKPGGEMVVTSFGSEIKTFNPISSNEVSSFEVLQFVFDGLVSLNPVDQTPVPCLAKSWAVSNDAKMYDFTLRDDVRWSDGTPFTADDVVFTFEALYDSVNISGARDNLTINGKKIIVTKTGQHSVRMELPYKFAPLMRMLVGTTTPILPKHKLAEAQAAGKFSSTWEVDTKVSEIVGTGPFTISAYETSPYLDKIIFSYVKDMSVELLKFKNGESDFFAMRGEDYSILKPLEASQNFTIYNFGPSYGNVFIMFNQNPGVNPQTKKPFMNPAKLSWFSNKRFRQAMAYAINRHEMVNIVHNGLGLEQDAPMGDATGYFATQNVVTYPYNPDSAKAILTAEGFVDRNNDGVREDKNGNTIEFSLITNAGNTDRQKYCELIRKDLEQVGVTVHFSLVEFNNMVDKLDNSFDWETIIIGHTGTDDPHDGNNIWQSSARNHHWYPNQKTPATAWEARIDTIFTQAAQEMDRSKRKALYDEWQRIYSEEVPYIILVSKLRLFAVRNRFGNINPVPTAESCYYDKRKFFHNISEIFVLPSAGKAER